MYDQRTTSRRRFLGTAAGATGVALAASAWKPAQAAAAIPDTGRGTQSPLDRRTTFRSGVFQLNLEGINAGILKSEDGGDAYAEVISVRPGGTSTFASKSISNFKYDRFDVQLGFGMNKAMYDWISASWKMQTDGKDGSIVTADSSSQALSERKFFDALITETGIPACDGSSKEAAYLTLQFAPEYTQDQKASGAIAASKQQKAWLSSNFKLEIDGIDTSRVAKVDAFTIKQSIITSEIGDTRLATREPANLEFPNLKITIGQASVSSWATWFDNFVIKGNNSSDYEKSGRLVFLSADLKTELAEIRLFNVGIYRLDPDQEDPSSADKIARFTAELYVERMEFNCPPAPVIT
ncbi:MAG: phage tail protein [Chloroflexota bacterium]